jgi:hypothetical protein
MVPRNVAEDLIRSSDDYDDRLLLVSRCATMRELDSGPESCKGNSVLVGLLPMTRLPTGQQLYQDNLRDPK